MDLPYRLSANCGGGWVIAIDPTGGQYHSREICYDPGHREICQDNCAGVYSASIGTWEREGRLTEEMKEFILRIDLLHKNEMTVNRTFGNTLKISWEKEN